MAGDLSEIMRNQDAENTRKALSSAAAVLSDEQMRLVCNALWSMPPERAFESWSSIVPPQAKRPAIVLQAAIDSTDVGSRAGVQLLTAGISEYMDEKDVDPETAKQYLRDNGMSEEQATATVQEMPSGIKLRDIISDYVLPFLTILVMARGAGGGALLKSGRAAVGRFAAGGK